MNFDGRAMNRKHNSFFVKKIKQNKSESSLEIMKETKEKKAVLFGQLNGDNFWFLCFSFFSPKKKKV
jgi:hypothetical protein